MIVITQKAHTSFRSEEIEYVTQIPSNENIKSLNTNTIEFSNKVKIGFKSGAYIIVICTDVTEASELLKIITDAMSKD